MPLIRHEPADRDPLPIRATVAVAALLALATFGWRMEAPVLCGTAAAVVVVSALIPYRWEMSRRAERITIGILAVPFLLGAVASFFSEEVGPFKAGPSMAGQFLVCLLILDFSLESVRRRTPILLAISFGILLLGGSARWGREFNRIYHAIAAGFALAVLAYVRAHAATAGRLGAVPARPERSPLAPLAIPVLLAVLSTVTIARFLPWAQGHVERAYADINRPELAQISAFNWNPRLGSMGRILRSERPVMRVFSERARLLRGRVLTSYEDGAWKSPVAPNPQVPAGPLPASDVAAGPGLAEAPGLEFPVPPSDTAPPRDQPIRTLRAVIDRAGLGVFFAPYLASVVKSDAPSVWVDPSGCLYPGGSPSEIEYAVGYREAPDEEESPGTAGPLAVAEREQQVALPDAHRDRFIELAREWCPADSRNEPLAAARALTTRLQSECRYSLEFQASGIEREPVIDFCRHRHVGQCEYFASAFVLLMRSLGHPARYVTGLAMTEWNRSGGYWLVREQDAHAWAEVYVERRGWVTMDPTPAGALASRETPGALGGWWDSWKLAWVRFWMRFDKMSWGERLAGAIEGALGWIQQPIHAAALAALLVLAGLWRRARRKRLSRREDPARPGAGESEPDWIPATHGALEQLWSALSARGLRRRPADTLLEFVSSLPGDRIDAMQRASISELLDRYARWRYGRVGPTPAERETFARDLASCAARLQVLTRSDSPVRRGT
ncbi:MAG: transglutaminase domain-containing protein [Planctomycetes bacterium]|nr:transglutaminase domain-containing protein [Planctomycetota bacterium]